MADNIKVAIRMRGLLDREKQAGKKHLWKVQDNQIKSLDGSRQSYCFDLVYGTEVTNEQIYQELISPIVQDAVNGIHGTCMAYGQTASGKTYTMLGNMRQAPVVKSRSSLPAEPMMLEPSQMGIIHFVVQDLYNLIQERQDRIFVIGVSYIEIYNEKIRNLLADPNNKNADNLKLQEDQNGDVTIKDLKARPVTETGDIIRFLLEGEANRHYGATQMNDRSSRSHTIFRISLESRAAEGLNMNEEARASMGEGSDIAEARESIGENTDDNTTAANKRIVTQYSHFNLVDLAGSENASQTGATGQRLTEGGHINKSLLTLGKVISQLSTNHEYISYRESKLTRIIQNSLGGNSKTALVCAITPAVLEETVSTLKFAQKAKVIKNKAVVNEIMTGDPLISQYIQKVKRLEYELKQAKEKETDPALMGLEIKEVQKKMIEQSKHVDELNTELAVYKKLLINFGCTLTTADHENSSNFVARAKRRATWCPDRNARGGAKNRDRELHLIDEGDCESDSDMRPGLAHFDLITPGLAVESAVRRVEKFAPATYSKEVQTGEELLTSLLNDRVEFVGVTGVNVSDDYDQSHRVNEGATRDETRGDCSSDRSDRVKELEEQVIQLEENLCFAKETLENKEQEYTEMLAEKDSEIKRLKRKAIKTSNEFVGLKKLLQVSKRQSVSVFTDLSVSMAQDATRTAVTEEINSLRSENLKLRESNEELIKLNEEVIAKQSELSNAFNESKNKIKELNEEMRVLKKQLADVTNDRDKLCEEHNELVNFTQYEKDLREESFCERQQEMCKDLLTRIRTLEKDSGKRSSSVSRSQNTSILSLTATPELNRSSSLSKYSNSPSLVESASNQPSTVTQIESGAGGDANNVTSGRHETNDSFNDPSDNQTKNCEQVETGSDVVVKLTEQLEQREQEIADLTEKLNSTKTSLNEQTSLAVDAQQDLINAQDELFCSKQTVQQKENLISELRARVDELMEEIKQMKPADLSTVDTAMNGNTTHHSIIDSAHINSEEDTTDLISIEDSATTKDSMNEQNTQNSVNYENFAIRDSGVQDLVISNEVTNAEQNNSVLLNTDTTCDRTSDIVAQQIKYTETMQSFVELLQCLRFVVESLDQQGQNNVTGVDRLISCIDLINVDNVSPDLFNELKEALGDLKVTASVVEDKVSTLITSEAALQTSFSSVMVDNFSNTSIHQVEEPVVLEEKFSERKVTLDSACSPMPQRLVSEAMKPVIEDSESAARRSSENVFVKELEEKKDLHKIIDGLRNELKSANSKLVDDCNRDLEYKKQHSETEQIIKDITADKAKIIKESNAIVQKLQSEVQDVTGRLRKVECDLQLSEHRLHQSQQEISALKAELNTVKESLRSDSSDQGMKRFGVMTDQDIAKLQDRVKKLTTQISLDSQRCARLELQNKEYEAAARKLPELEVERNSYKAQLSDSRQQLNELRAEISRLQQLYSSTFSEQSTMKLKMSNLEHNVEQLKTEKLACEKSVEQLSVDKQALTEELKKLLNELEMLKTENSKLQSLVDEAKLHDVKQRREIDEYIEKMKSLADEKQEFEQKKEKELEELRSLLENKTEESLDNLNQDDNANLLQQTLAEQEKMVSDLEARLCEEREKIEAELDKCRKEKEAEYLQMKEMLLSECETEKITAVKTVQDENTSLVALVEAEKDSLKQQVEILKARVQNESSNELARVEAEKDSLKEEVEMLKARVQNESSNELACVEEEKKALKHEVETLQARVVELSNDNSNEDVIEERIQEMKAQLKVEFEEISSIVFGNMEREKDVLRQEIETLQARVGELSNDNGNEHVLEEKLREVRQKLEDEFEVKNVEVEKIRRELEERLQQKEDELNSLKRSLEVSVAEIVQLKEQLSVAEANAREKVTDLLREKSELEKRLEVEVKSREVAVAEIDKLKNQLSESNVSEQVNDILPEKTVTEEGLQQELKSKEEIVKSLELKVKQSEEKYELLLSEMMGLEERLNGLQDQSEKDRREVVDNYEARLAELSDDLSQVSSAKEQGERTISKLNSEVERLKEEVRVLKGKDEENEEVIKKEQLSVLDLSEKVKESEENVVRLRETVDNQNKIIASLEKDLEANKCDYEAKLFEVEKSQRDMTSESQRISELQREIDQITAVRVECEEMINDLNSVIASLRDEIVDLKSQIETKDKIIAEERSILTDINNRMKESEAKVLSLENQVHSKDEKINLLENELIERKADYEVKITDNSHQETLADSLKLVQQQDEINQLKSAKEQCESVISGLKTDLKSLTDETTELRSVIDTKDATIIEERQKIVEVTRLLREHEVTKARLGETISKHEKDYETRIAELERNLSERVIKINQLEKELNDLTAAKENCHITIDNKNEQISALKSQLSGMTEQIVRLEKEIEEKNVIVLKEKSNVEDLSKKTADLEGLVARHMETVGNLEKANEKLKKDLEECENDYEELRVKSGEYGDIAVGYQNQCEELEKKNKELEKRIEELMKNVKQPDMEKMKQLESDLKRVREQRTQLFYQDKENQKELEKLRQEKVEARNQAEKLYKQVTDAEAKIKELEIQVKDIKRTEELKKELRNCERKLIHSEQKMQRMEDKFFDKVTELRKERDMMDFAGMRLEEELRMMRIEQNKLKASLANASNMSSCASTPGSGLLSSTVSDDVLMCATGSGACGDLIIVQLKAHIANLRKEKADIMKEREKDQSKLAAAEDRYSRIRIEKNTLQEKYDVLDERVKNFRSHIKSCPIYQLGNEANANTGKEAVGGAGTTEGSTSGDMAGATGLVKSGATGGAREGEGELGSALDEIMGVVMSGSVQGSMGAFGGRMGAMGGRMGAMGERMGDMGGCMGSFGEYLGAVGGSMGGNEENKENLENGNVKKFYEIRKSCKESREKGYSLHDKYYETEAEFNFME